MKKLLTISLLVVILLCGCSTNSSAEYFKERNKMTENDYMYIIDSLNQVVYKDVDITVHYNYNNNTNSAYRHIQASMQRATDEEHLHAGVLTNSSNIDIISNKDTTYFRTSQNDYTEVLDSDFMLMGVVLDTINITRDLSALFVNERVKCEFIEEVYEDDNSYGLVIIDTIYTENEEYEFYTTFDGNVVKLTDEELETYEYEDNNGTIRKLTKDDIVINTYRCYINSETGFIDKIIGINKVYGYEYTMGLSREATYNAGAIKLNGEQLELPEAIEAMYTVLERDYIMEN